MKTVEAFKHMDVPGSRILDPEVRVEHRLAA